MKDFLRIGDLDPDRLAAIVERAGEVKKDPASVEGALAGARVGLFFMKPSLRTRVASELAALELGALPIVLSQDEVGLGTRESVADVARVLDRYLDVLAFRVFSHADLVEVSAHARAPVINLLSDLEHPGQALADLQTIEEHRELSGTTLAYVGDGNNVCHSLMMAAAMSDMTVNIATPVGCEPLPEYVTEAGRYARVSVGNDPGQAVEGADVVYTDVWASMGQEAETIERATKFARYQVNAELFSQASNDAIFLHNLPAHRGEEVTDEVIDHPRSRVFDQAENRLHSFKALLLHLGG